MVLNAKTIRVSIKIELFENFYKTFFSSLFWVQVTGHLFKSCPIFIEFAYLEYISVKGIMGRL